GAAEACWYARRGSGIRRLAETDGKTVAYSSPGSSTNLILLQLVNQAKVAPKLVATGGAPATLTQVMSGQIDVGWSVPPFVLQQLSDGKLVIIARGSDVPALTQQTIRVNVANANVLKERRDAFVRFIKALSRAIDWAYSDPEAIDHYAEITKVSRALARQTRSGGSMPRRSAPPSASRSTSRTGSAAVDFSVPRRSRGRSPTASRSWYRAFPPMCWDRR